LLKKALFHQLPFILPRMKFENSSLLAERSVPVPPQVWSARLELAFGLRSNGATVPTLRRHYGPLRVQKSFYPEGEGVCHQIVVHPPGGIAGGDHLTISLEVGDGAHALLTSPGAAKWYCAYGRPAYQTLQFKVGADAALEWLPQETILFDGSEPHLASHIELAATARLIFADVVCLGRPAAGERFSAGHWQQHTRVSRDGRLLWAEPVQLAGGDPLLDSRVGLAGHSVVGTLLWAGPALPPELHQACRAVPAQGMGAVSQLPEVWLARFVGDSAEAAHAYFRELWRSIRPWALGREAVAPRIWNT
jgi:urease accessory protein